MITKKRLIVSVFLLLVAVFVAICIVNGTAGEKLPWGRDTVKQFSDGNFEILRSASVYSFRSSDSKVYLDGISHYYDAGTDIYLICDNNVFAHIDVQNGVMNKHEEIELFEETHQQVFREKKFIELPLIESHRNIWDILFGEK